MTKETQKKLGTSPRKVRRAFCKQKRQEAFAYILKNPVPMTNVELAEAIGFDMSVPGTHSYQEGASFIQRMLRGRHISCQICKDDPKKKLWYVTTKENVECKLFTKPKKIEEKSEPEEIETSREMVLENIDNTSDDSNSNVFNISISVRKGYDSVELEQDDISKEDILNKVKKLLELL